MRLLAIWGGCGIVLHQWEHVLETKLGLQPTAVLPVHASFGVAQQGQQMPPPPQQQRALLQVVDAMYRCFMEVVIEKE
jgi:hypothetical protein